MIPSPASPLRLKVRSKGLFVGRTLSVLMMMLDTLLLKRPSRESSAVLLFSECLNIGRPPSIGSSRTETCGRLRMRSRRMIVGETSSLRVLGCRGSTGSSATDSVLRLRSSPTAWMRITLMPLSETLRFLLLTGDLSLAQRASARYRSNGSPLLHIHSGMWEGVVPKLGLTHRR